jgi:osmotically-inducible protein OsmY
MTKDIEIQKDVMEELKSIPLINASEIGVSVKNGVVTLSGTADSYPKKIAIERAVKKLNGVKAVAEDIKVYLTEKHQKTDSEIAHMAMRVIEWSVHPINDLKVLVEDSCITLEGNVDWDFQRKSVTKVLGNIVGVKKIINNLTLAHKPTSSEVKHKIQAAFVRSANIDADKINITTEGNKVTLTGKINNWIEYEEAERSVWATPGVSVVENKLELEDVI